MDESISEFKKIKCGMGLISMPSTLEGHYIHELLEVNKTCCSWDDSDNYYNNNKIQCKCHAQDAEVML